MKIEFQNPIDRNKKDGVCYKKEIDALNDKHKSGGYFLCFHKASCP